MKKLWLMIIFLLGTGLSIQAQMLSNNMSQKEPVAIGLKGGMNIPRMLYFRNTALGRLPQAWNFTPTGGLFVEIPVSNLLILSPEAMFVQRGTDIEYTHISSGSQVHYAMNVSYADLRLPFEFRLPVAPAFQPYIVAGAEVGMRLFGEISLKRSAPLELNETIEVGDANMGLIHAGVFGGVGIRSRFNIGAMGLVLKLSASYHQGLLDTYSAMEKQEAAQAVNVNAYHVSGWRLPQGIEVTLGAAIPLKLVPKDACASFANDRYRRHGSRGRLFGF